MFNLMCFHSIPVSQVNTGARLLRDVRHDLEDVVEVCEARKKQTNYLRSLTSDLTKGNPVLPDQFWDTCFLHRSNFKPFDDLHH